jgi:hypothetical protein
LDPFWASLKGDFLGFLDNSRTKKSVPFWKHIPISLQFRLLYTGGTETITITLYYCIKNKFFSCLFLGIHSIISILTGSALLCNKPHRVSSSLVLSLKVHRKLPRQEWNPGPAADRPLPTRWPAIEEKNVSRNVVELIF